ncbi:MAG: LCP family protein [Pseudonocardiaceae bacterium]
MLGRVLAVVLLLLAALAVYIDLSLNRVDALPDYPERVANTAGTNWLVVGSDSREGLSAVEQSELATGGEVGSRRTDTIMLLHIPALGTGGKPTLVSLPRDSSVPLPGTGERVKLNSTYASGGAPLLAQTLEVVTGIHIDHYLEVGFGGFAGIVDDVGGVELCLDEPINDPLAGIDLPAGCQQLDGAQALGYVRTRATANGDLDRVERQREFLGALVNRSTSPAVLLNPFRIVPLATGVSDAVTVDNGDHIWHLARLGWAMRGISSGGVVTTTVPIGGFGDLDDGSSAVLWDREGAVAMFEALANDEPVPPELLPR